MSESLEVKKRSAVGSRPVMKLRSEGFTPAILYGHGEENINLSVSTDSVNALIEHGSKLVNLTGEINDTAILKDVQWDSMGTDIIHLDFARVNKNEKVEMSVPIELHGEAPGTNNGGMLQFLLHEVNVACAADKIPEHIVVDISSLKIGDSIHASDVGLDDGVEMLTQASEVIVAVAAPKRGGKVTAEAEESAEGAEPEVISKGGGDESESE